MAKKPSLTDGSVELTLCDEPFVLTASLEATLKLSQGAGGLSRLVQAVRDLDFQACASIVAIGAGLDAKAAKRVPELLYRHGLVAAQPQLMEFVLILTNGGKPFVDLDDDEEGEGEAGNA